MILRKLTFSLILSTSLLACTDDDDSPSRAPGTPVNYSPNCELRQDGYQLNFQDRNLEGLMENEPFVFTMGNVNTTTWTNDFTHRFELIGHMEDDSCNSNMFSNKSRVIFSISDTSPILNVGQHYLLDTNFSTRTGSFVTLVHNQGDTGVLNIITGRGGYEITRVDTSAKIVEGKLDICLNDENYVNGSFRAKYCFW